jgi:hypothetical protein
VGDHTHPLKKCLQDGCSDKTLETHLIELASTTDQQVGNMLYTTASTNAPLNAKSSTTKQGEGIAALTTRFFFWLSVGVMYAVQVIDMIKARWHDSDSPVRERWNTIWTIVPEYEDWKHTLTCYDNVEVILSELCERPYPKQQIERFSGDDLRLFHDLDKLLADPVRDSPQEVDLTRVQREVALHDKELQQCWDTAKDHFHILTLGVERMIPRLLAVIFAVAIFLNLRDGSNPQECIEIGLYAERMCTMSGDSNCLGMIHCTNGNRHGSICIMTCPARYQEINWHADSTSPIVVCGEAGGWLGNLLLCRSNSDFTYR